MTSLYVALFSILAIVILVYMGFHVAIVLCAVSLISVYLLRDDFVIEIGRAHV